MCRCSTDPVFADYMQAYGEGGLRAVRLGAIDAAGAALLVHGGVRPDPRGGGPAHLWRRHRLQPRRESLFALDEPSRRPRIAFDLKRVMRTRYRIDDYQQAYFVIDSFEDLLQLDAGDRLRAALPRRWPDDPDIEPGAVIAGDHPDLRIAERAPMTRDLFDNPLGTDGFEFVEFTAPDPAALQRAVRAMGFTRGGTPPLQERAALHARATSTSSSTWSRDGQAAAFRGAHGPSVNAMAFRVQDAGQGAASWRCERGAKPVAGPVGPMELNIPAIEGIGGSQPLSGRSLRRRRRSTTSISCRSRARRRASASGAGLTYIDHLTHNVHRGNMEHWADFYERIFNFREIRYFDIEGKLTGLISQGHDQPGRQDPHPAQREPGRQIADRGIPARLSTARASSTSRWAPPTSTPRSSACARAA